MGNVNQFHPIDAKSNFASKYLPDNLRRSASDLPSVKKLSGQSEPTFQDVAVKNVRQLQLADPCLHPLMTRKELAFALRIGISTLSERYNPNSKRYDPTFPRPVKRLKLSRRVTFDTCELNHWFNQHRGY